MKRLLLSIFLVISTHAMIAQPDDVHHQFDKKSLRNPSTPQAYLSSMYGDAYVQAVSISPVPATPGAAVRSGGGAGYDLERVFGQNTTANVILIVDDGTTFIAANDPNNLRTEVAQFNADKVWNLNYGTAGIATIPYQGATAFYLNQDLTLLVAGADNVAGGWIAQLTLDGSLDTANFAPSTGGFFTDSQAYGFYALGVQQSGRIVVARGDGVVMALRSNGTTDPSFAVYETGTQIVRPAERRGGFTVLDAAGQGLYALAINPATDDIYVSYIDANSFASIAKLNADGDDYDQSFGINGLLPAENRLPNVAGPSQVRLGITTDNKLVLGMVNASNQYVLQRYNVDGSPDTTFNVGNPLIVQGEQTAYISQLLMTTANQMLISGVENDGDNQMVLFRVAAGGTYDTDFNNNVVPFVINPFSTVRGSMGLALYATGTIIPAGFEQDAFSSNNRPLAYEVAGDAFVTQYPQAPGVTDAGYPDFTFNRGVSATHVISDIPGCEALQGSIPVVFYNYHATPSYLSIATKGSDVLITRITQDLALDDTFNAGHVLILSVGSKWGSTSAVVTSMCFDLASGDTDSGQAFYLAGTKTRGFTDSGLSTSKPFVCRIGADGIVDPQFELQSLPGMTSATAIAQNSWGRLYLAGKSGGKGAVTAFTPSGALDLAWGNGSGMVVFEGSEEITALLVDGFDRVLVAYRKPVGDANIVRLDASGLAIDPTFEVTDTIQNVAGNANIKMCFDENQDIIVGAVNKSGKFVACRYWKETGSRDDSFNGNGQLVWEFSPSAPDAITTIQSLSCNGNGKIAALGTYESVDDYRSMQASILNTGSFDLAFNMGNNPGDGLAELRGYYAAMHFSADRRMVMLGNLGDDAPVVLTRRFGAPSDYAQTLQNQPAAADLGTFDVSLGYSHQGYQDVTPELGEGTPEAIISLADGKSLVAMQTPAGARIARFDSQYHLDYTYGTRTPGYADVTSPGDTFTFDSMWVDALGTTYVLETDHEPKRSRIRVDNFDGTSNRSFGGDGQVQLSLTQATSVKTNSTGLIIVAGQDSVGACMEAYRQNGQPVTWFGQNGKLYIGSSEQPVQDFIIDAYNRLVTITFAPDHTITLARYLADGSGPDFTFDTGGSIPDALHSAVTHEKQAFVAQDDAGNIYVAGRVEGGLKMACYDSSGNLKPKFGDHGMAIIFVTDPIVFTSFLTNASDQNGDEDKKFVMTALGYNAEADNNYLYATWINQHGALAFEYNPYGQTPGTFEWFVAHPNIPQKLTQATIMNDGRIVCAAAKLDKDASEWTPMITRLCNQRYVSEAALAPAYTQFVSVETLVSAASLINRYGSNKDRFNRMILKDYLLKWIKDFQVRADLSAKMDAILAKYAEQHKNVPSFNLVAGLASQYQALNALQAQMQKAYPGSYDDINKFFTAFYARIKQVQP